MSFFPAFSHVGCDERLNFGGFATLAGANVFFLRIPGRWREPTFGKIEIKDIDIGQRPDFGSLGTLDVTNRGF